MQKPICIAYARCSTLLFQDPENQLVHIRKYADASGFELVGEYIDHGISGTKERRPELDRLIADAKSGKIKDAILIVAAIDRIGRSTLHLLSLLEELKGYGIRLISLRENLNFTGPTGEMILTVLAAISTLERANIAERIKQSLAAKKLVAEQTGNGWRCGRPIKVTSHTESEILRLRSEGLSYREIGKLLNVSKTTALRVVQKHEKEKGIKKE